MISITELKSVGQASSYYEKDNYYTKDAAEIKDSTQWYGKGAEMLALSGEVDFSVFKKLLAGTLPDGTQLGWSESATKNHNDAHPDKKRSTHRPGYDITFSAPKSVSLVALLGDDKRILAAHERAVDKALSYIEKEGAQTRMSEKGKKYFIKTDNLTIARFQHDVSRELDPQLHTHCVIMNMTHTHKGWRSLSSEKLFDYKMATGSLYRVELAHGLQQLGYGITKTHKDGRFHITGIPLTICKQFSKRREKIEKALEESGREGPEASAEITLKTRQSKRRIERDELHRHWKMEEALSGFDMKAFVKHISKAPVPHPSSKSIKKTAQKAVEFGIAHLSEFNSTLDHDELRRLSLREAIGGWVSTRHIEQAITDKLSKGDLLIHENEKKEYTTPTLLREEKTVLSELQRKITPITYINYFVEKFLEEHPLSLTKTALARLILQGKNQYVLAENFKDANDLTILKPLAHFAESRSHAVRVFTVSQESAQFIHSQTDIMTQTYSQLLSTPKAFFQKFKQKSLWFIHKAERLSTHEHYELTSRAKLARARVIFLQTEQPLLSVGAGHSPRLLQKANIPSVRLRDSFFSSDIKKESKKLHSAVTKLYGQINEQKQVLSSPNSLFRYYTAAMHVMEKPDTLVVTLQADIKSELTHVIRDMLKTKGIITGKELTTSILIRQALSPAEKSLARFYDVNHQCRFTNTNRWLGIKKDEPYTIIKNDGKILHLQDSKGKTRRWDPSRHKGAESVSVFSPQERKIAVGDRIRMSVGDENKRWVAGDIQSIIRIEEFNLFLRNDKGKTAILNINTFSGKQWDHAYVMSPYQVPDHKPHSLLLYIESKNFNMASHRALLTAFHQRNTLPWVVTDNPQKLQEKLATYLPPTFLATDKDFSKQLGKVSYDAKSKENFQMRFALDAVDCAMEMLAEREAVFKSRDLIKNAMALAVGQTSSEYIHLAINDFEAKGELISIEDHFTTLASLEREQSVVDWVTEGKNKLLPIYPEKLLLEKINPLPDTQLNAEQKQAVMSILTSTDQLEGIQGYPGTGKTRLLQSVKYFSAAVNVPIMGVAPSASAAEQIFRKAGIPSVTLERYLIESQKESFFTDHKDKPSILVVDESSMTSTRQVDALKTAVVGLPIHVVLQGDTVQLPAVEAGKPFALLQAVGMHTCELTTIQRQTNQTLLKAVYESRDTSSLSAAWKRLAPHIVESPDQSLGEAIKALLTAYKTLSPQERADTLVITASNEDRRALNAGIREILKNEAILTGEEKETRVLISHDMTSADKTIANHFSGGDVIRFNGIHKRLGITPNTYCEVISTDIQTNTLTLKHEDGRTFNWSPHTASAQRGFVEAYFPVKRPIQVGEYIRWRRNDQERGIINAQTAHITHIESPYVTVTLQNGKNITLDISQPHNQHWDHAYTSTVHVAQGADAKRLLVLMNSAFKKLHHLKSFHTTISRAINDIRIFTDNLERIQKFIAENQGDKTSSLEATGQLKVAPNKSSVKNVKSPIPASSEPFSAKPHSTPPAAPQWDVGTINHFLKERAEEIATRLLGEPKNRTGHTIKFGTKKGSLHLTVAGEKQGLWFDFQTNKGGSLLTLIQDIHQCSFKEALNMAADMLRLAPGTVITPATPSLKKEAKSPHALTPQQVAMRKYANKLFEEGKPIERSLGEKYLAHHRGIKGPYPSDAMRFHSGVKYGKGQILPAVLFAARDEKGNINAIQAVFLNHSTGAKADVDVVKKTYGSPQGAAVRVQKGTIPGVEAYAEGPETALSIARAFPTLTVKTTLGISHMLNSQWSNDTRAVILCADNDGVGSPSERSVKAIQERLTALGKVVQTVQPNEGLKDFNDVLKQQGLKEVVKVVNPALSTVVALSSHSPKNTNDLHKVFWQDVFKEGPKTPSPDRPIPSPTLDEKNK